jgi:hypothetical protein
MTRRDDAWAAANGRWDARKPVESAGPADAGLARDLARVDTLLQALRARGAARRRRRGLATLGVAAALVLSLHVSGAWSETAVAPLTLHAEHAQPIASLASPVTSATPSPASQPAPARAPGRILSSRLAVERTVHLPAGWVSAGAHRGANP